MRARRGAPARGHRGETLLEILVTVAIMGTAFMGILAGVGTTFTATDTQRKGATAEAVLRSYGERLQDPTDVPYVNCATTATYASPIGFTLPTGGWTAVVTTLNRWQGDPLQTFTAACPSPDKGLQQLTLTVKSPPGNRQTTVTLVIVKRRP